MRQLTDTLSGTRRLLDMAPSETVGVTVDFSNFSFAGEDLRRVIPALGSRMVNAHVKNGSLGPGGAWLFNDLATGLTDYAEVLPMLRDVGYTGHLAIECLGRDAASRPVETATRDLAILRRYIDAAGEASS
jgi:sugar phosphate isomerase/epimerase